MTIETTGNPLSAKYDQIYGNGEVDKYVSKNTSDTEVALVQISGWPINRNDALVYLTRPGGRLLEIGCGSGIVLATLASGFDELVGVELSSARAEQALQRLAHLPNCHILSISLEALSTVVTSPFDCILWADVIEHVPDVIEAMHILADLSRVGTQLVTTTPNIAFLPRRLHALLGRGPNTALPLYCNEGFAEDPTQTVLHDAGHFHYFTFRQVEILYRLAGFRPEQRLGFGRRLSHLRNYWPTLLSGTVCMSGTFQGKPMRIEGGT